MAAAIPQLWQVVLLLALSQAVVLVVACRTDVQTVAPSPSRTGRIGESSQHGWLGRISEECNVRELQAKPQGWAVERAVV